MSAERKPHSSELFEEVRFYIDRALKADYPLTHYAQAMKALEGIEEQLETAREALERISTYGSHYTPHTGIARDALDALNPAREPQSICLCSNFKGNVSFDRSICACGSMHYYCDDCGWQTDACDPEPVEASNQESERPS